MLENAGYHGARSSAIQKKQMSRSLRHQEHLDLEELAPQHWEAERLRVDTTTVAA